MSYPAIHEFPLVGLNIPVNIEIRVVFPAPFGPSKPNNSPLLTLRHIDLFAIFGGLLLNPG